MTEALTIDTIVSLLNEFCDTDSPIIADTELLESGLLDSLAFIELLSALEDMGFDIQPTRYPKSNFATAETIYNMCTAPDKIL